jgi:peptidoglycan/xylan/chitin deacetylase (PgdA/CDA1 family)
VNRKYWGLVVLITFVFAAQPAVANTGEPIYRIKTNDPVAFITIDDGIVKSLEARDYIEKHQIPITTFITTAQIKDRATYFERVSRWGSIQNHTTTHRSFADPRTNVKQQLCGAQKAIRSSFNTRPWMMRPPYGAAADATRVRVAANACGIRDIVMWDAYVWFGRIAFKDGELKPGSIILLHFTSSLPNDLRIAMRLITRAGLTPANLADYLLPPSRLNTTWQDRPRV